MFGGGIEVAQGLEWVWGQLDIEFVTGDVMVTFE